MSDSRVKMLRRLERQRQALGQSDNERVEVLHRELIEFLQTRERRVSAQVLLNSVVRICADIATQFGVQHEQVSSHLRELMAVYEQAAKDRASKTIITPEGAQWPSQPLHLLPKPN